MSAPLLWTALDGLIRPGKVRIARDAAPWMHDVDGWMACDVAEFREIQQIRAEIRAAGRAASMASAHGITPSLWQQACDALTTGSESDGTGGTTPARERSPADLALMTLLHKVTTRVGQAVGTAELPTSAVPVQLRVVAGRAVRSNTATIGTWTQRLKLWTEQLQQHLQAAVDQPARAVYLRGTGCPACGIRQVVQPVYRGDNIVLPALYVTFTGDLIRAAECLACRRVWWRGEIGALAELLGLDPTPAKELTP